MQEAQLIFPAKVARLMRATLALVLEHQCLMAPGEKKPSLLARQGVCDRAALQRPTPLPPGEHAGFRPTFSKAPVSERPGAGDKRHEAGSVRSTMKAINAPRTACAG